MFASYHNHEPQNFKFKYLTDELQQLQFNVTGYISGETAVIRDIDFFISDGFDDFIEVKGSKNIESWFRKLGAEQVLERAMFSKYGTSFSEVKF